MRADRKQLAIVAVVTTAICGGLALVLDTSQGPAAVSASVPTAAATAAAGDLADTAVLDDPSATTATEDSAAPVTTVDPGALAVASDSDTPDLVGDEDLAVGDNECVMEPVSLRIGSTGDSVTCLQKALVEAGYGAVQVSGSYDNATYAAVERLQTERNLYVDGVAGRETGISLGIWPDEQMFVVRTPAPAPGAVDLWGYPLSSVASAGDDAPPLPEDSGSGKRIVYYRAGQRAWAVDADERIVRSWLVSGSQYSNELPGTHAVYSKSEVSTAWNGKAYLPKMVRWLKTEIGAIGFHGIPTKVSDGSPYQTEAELGQRLSGGCQRQANPDADFLWDFAEIGTPVVVI